MIVFLFLVPIVLLGRHVFDTYLIDGGEVHDIYSFTIGIILMLTLGFTLNWISHKYAMLRAGGYRMAMASIVTSCKENMIRVSYGQKNLTNDFLTTYGFSPLAM